MNNPESPTDNNDNSLQTILKAIRLSQGQLSLIFLRCNYAKLRQQIAAQLKEISSIPIREITLPASAKSLYNHISEELTDSQPQALMIFGLDSVNNIDAILSLSNQIREEFRKNFTFPILIWIDDQILRRIIRVAPDLENWGSIIDFENDSEDLVDFLQETTAEIFTNDVTPSPQVYKEIESASQDLQNRGEEIDPEIQASLDLIFGLREYQQDHLDNALIYYQRSLEFWQTHNNLERHGILLVKIASAYSRKAEINNTENQENWQNARDNLQQALDIFEQGSRLDLVIEYINHLGEILRHQKAWNDLEILAQKSLKLYNVETLHRTSLHNTEISLQRLQIGLCQNYGFLAEVALKKEEWLKANQNAEQAIEILSNLPNVLSHERTLYRLLLALSHVGLGDYVAIEILEIAKNESRPQYNPKLYIDILEQLNLLYFQEEEYLKAFEIKQEILQIKQQYGFTAFVGASYLNPQRKVIKSENSEVENNGTIAQEISASGREEDVKRLRGRIAVNEHKLTVIHGQSGVGKSSILQGGLIPALQQEPIGERNSLPILLRVYTNWVEILGQDLKIEINEYSTDGIIHQLRKNETSNLLTVLIFDQFEEFFFVYTDQKQRRQFYDFLRVCLDIPYVKIVLSLREDYLHYLLELDRLVDLTVTNNNILDKNIRYYLGNFSPADAKAVIQSLTEKTNFYLQPGLIDKLVEDLAGDIGEVRPIELQIVGTQLQSKQIQTLDKYQEFGKEKLVEKFLEDVIKECGEENEQTARLVLYLLTDENGTRPLKTRAELVEQLPAESENLDLVLNIFVASGLVLLLPESPADRYQLVHDYLVEFIRQQQGNELLEELSKTKAELKEVEEARQVLANAKIEADKQLKKGQKRLRVSSILALGLVVIAGMASVYSINQFRETGIAKQVTQLEQSGMNILRQFQFEVLRSLIIAIQNGQGLKNLLKDDTPLDQYPTTSPIYVLNIILDDIEKPNQLQGHQQAVNSVSFSPDGKTIATASSDSTVRLWNLKGELLHEFKGYQSYVKGHQSYVNSVSFSPDGKTIATASSDSTVRLWNLQGKELQKFEGHQSIVNSVSFSPDGQTIATASSDDTARLWNLQGKELQKFKGHEESVNSVSFSPDGQTIATASFDKTARLWNLQGKELQKFKGHQSYVRSVSFSPDGQTIATASSDSTAR
ncbi:hypothetical protein VB713_07335, partial [Anabaena cylindrica UHCC 0172]|uniref:nSTAND1 domain-containing NTPase n=1 Tax=Anabaena cylindrica TaxID=1165 RepID=UPI002B219EAE